MGAYCVAWPLGAYFSMEGNLVCQGPKTGCVLCVDNSLGELMIILEKEEHIGRLLLLVLAKGGDGGSFITSM